MFLIAGAGSDSVDLRGDARGCTRYRIEAANTETFLCLMRCRKTYEALSYKRQGRPFLSIDLFIAKRHHRIHACCSMRRQKSCEQSDHCQYTDCDQHRRGIVR